MSKSELEKYYRETSYIVFIDGKQYKINIDQTIPAEIQQQINTSQEQTAVIITAWNPKSQPLSSQKNKVRNRELNSELKKHTVFKALGQGGNLSDTLWPAEESYFIIGIQKREADMLAVKYEQYAYVWLESKKPASLIFTQMWQSYDD